MTPAAKLTEPKLLAELVAGAIQNHIGGVGVIVRDVGSPDSATLLQKLKELHDAEQPELRVAYLHDDVAKQAKAAGFKAKEFSTEVEQAERWRNERDLTALIVVVAAGDEAKLSSLEDFGSITSKDLKRGLVDRALGGPAGENDVQLEWWGMLRDDDSIGLGQLTGYYLALAGKTGADFGQAASRELHRLGLLPDPAFFDSPKPAALRKRLLDNRELVQRLQTLTPKDRRTIKEVVGQEKNEDQKARLRKALDQLHRTRWEGEGMGAIDFEAAERLIKARTKKKPKPGADGEGDDKPTKTTEKAVEVAAESLVDPDRDDDLNEVLEELQKCLGAVDDTSVRTEKVRTLLSSSSVEVTAMARFDVINLVAKLLDDGLYGGLLKSESDEINAILRRFNAEEDIVHRWQRDEIRTVLEHLAEGNEVGGELVKLFEAYDKARTKVLPYLRSLAAEPLVVAANKDARAAMLGSITAYEALTDGLWKHYDEIFETVGPDIEELLTSILLLDLIVIQGGQDGSKVFTILSPVHPLYLWHYGTYADIVEAQRKELSDKDKVLIAAASSQLPNFLTSLYVPATALGAGMSLNAAGRLGALPYYAKDVESNSSEDGIDSISDLISAYISLEPHAELGFRLALIDPPAVGSYLRSIIDLKDSGVLAGAHVVVFRRRGGASVELRLDEDDEDRVAQVFRALSMDRRFTFEVREINEGDLGPTEDEPFHLAVVFDRSDGRANRSRPATHPIQPLAMPRRLQYSQVHKTVELEPAPGGLFEAYNKVVGRVSEGGRSSYLAVHQQQQLREALADLAQKMSWVAVADRQVDRDLTLDALRVFTAREGERDIAAFAQSPSAFRRPLREVARGYNAYITDDELDGLLAQLSDLLDQGLLNLKPDHTGRTNHNRIKGLLGTLIAARWFREAGASGTRLLISLDSAEARRWMHLSDDPLRADLVGLEWTNDHCTVSVMEVKAVQASTSEYKVEDGKATGPAIEQMLATRRLLSAVLSDEREGELITTPARREVLREHFYRELTKGIYDPAERKLWADRLQRLLDGKVKADVRCQLVDVRLGVDVDSLQERSVVATDGEEEVPTQITELNEVGIAALQQTETPVPPDDDTEDDGGVEPPPGPEPETPTDGESEEPAPSGEEPEPAVTEPESQVEVTPEPESEAGETKETEEAAEATQVAEAAVGRPRALLGTAPGKYGKPREVWFDPAHPDDPLPNPHISITGETGSGKTQATKAIITELQQQGLPILILDFKDDYAEEGYAEAEGFRVYDASFDSLPFNPLMPAIDKRQNRVNPAHHIHQLSDIVKRIYKLGDQQAYRFREAVKAAYEDSGLGNKPTVVTDETVFPPFDSVRDHLAGDKANEALLGRLSPIFDLGLFSSAGAEEDLDQFLQESVVVRLGQLPGDETKNSVAEFFLMALYNFLIRAPHTHALGRLLILDEAWRLVESPFMIPLMREGRAFGLGVVIATQFPRDLPEAVRGSTATRLFFSQSQVEQVREVQRTIVGKTSGSEADHVSSVMRSLSPLTCILHSKQYEQFVRLAIKPYFERRSERDA
jgi:hypothetical protein